MRKNGSWSELREYVLGQIASDDELEKVLSPEVETYLKRLSRMYATSDVFQSSDIRVLYFEFVRRIPAHGELSHAGSFMDRSGRQNNKATPHNGTPAATPTGSTSEHHLVTESPRAMDASPASRSIKQSLHDTLHKRRTSRCSLTGGLTSRSSIVTDEMVHLGLSALMPKVQVVDLIVNTFKLIVKPESLTLLVREAHDDMVRLNRRKVKKRDDGLDFEGFLQVVYDVKRGKEPRTLQKQTMLPIDPEAPKKQLWDLLIMLFLMYTTFSVPWILAFDTGEDPWILTPFEVYDMCLDCLFMLDVCLSFVTSYTHQGFYVTDLRLIALHYVRTWFLPDIAGSFPFDKVAVAIMHQTGNTAKGDLQFMLIFKALRMLKLVRALRLLNKLNQLEQKEGFATFKRGLRIWKSIFLIIFVAHVLGCVFILLINPNDANNWLHAYSPEAADSDNWTKYIVALYWATVSVSTIGYGDVLPVTHEERMFSILVSLIDAVVFSYCMGSITSLISETMGSDVRFDERMRVVTEYAEFRQLPKALTRRIKRHFMMCWRKEGELHEEGRVLRTIPSDLVMQARSAISKLHTHQISFFSSFEDEVQGELFTRLRVQFYSSDEVVYKAFEAGDDMHIVLSGRVLLCPHAHVEEDYVFAKDSLRTSVVGPGETFGECVLFPDICRYRFDSAVAMDPHTELLCLSRHDVQLMGHHFPHAVAKLRAFCTLKALAMGCTNAQLEAAKLA